MKQIFLVRHGESKGNDVKIFKPPDTPMTQLGHTQARELASRCALLDPDLLLTSSLTRAVETARYIAKTCNISYTLDENFTGVRCASKMIGRSKVGNEADEYTRTIRTLYEGDVNARFEDAENVVDIIDRIDSGLASVAAGLAERVVIVSHESLIKKIGLYILRGGKLTLEDNFECINYISSLSHTGISEFVYVDGKWRMVRWNDDSAFAN